MYNVKDWSKDWSVYGTVLFKTYAFSYNPFLASPVISSALIRSTRHFTGMSMTCRSMSGPPPISVTHIGHNGARKGVLLHVSLSPFHIRLHITSASASFWKFLSYLCPQLQVPSSCDFYRRNFYWWRERITLPEEESKRISLHKHWRTSTTVCFASVILYCTCTRDRW